MIDGNSASVTEATYHRLRADLLTGELVPGSKLKIGELCQRMGVNLSAIREALTRLAAEGMVVAEPQRGFRAAPISADDLRDLTQVRIDIETLCVSRSIEHGDIAWESRVIAASHALSKTHKPSSGQDAPGYRAWRTAHVTFHDALCSACGSPWLLRLRGQLSVQHQRYLWLSFKLSRARRQADDEHRKLTASALARDADAATKLITEHFWVTTDNLLSSPLLAAELEPQPVSRARRARVPLLEAGLT